MGGGKIFNQIQRGSFQHRSMAAALRLQLGPGWVSKLWEREIGELTWTVYDEVSSKQKTEVGAGSVLKNIKND